MTLMFDVPNAPARPLTWIQRETLVAVAGDAVTDDVRQLIARYIGQFFADVAPDHPQLAERLRENASPRP